MRSLLLAFSSLLLAGPGGAQEPAPLPSAGGESVDVNIRIVPFYAVDADGKPVFDLRQDEVELRIGGKPVPIDTFDGPPAAAPPAAPAPPGGTERSGARQSSAPGPRRSVIFFFDTAFTSPAGLRNGRMVAEKLLREIPEGQRVSLWSHGATTGLRQRVAAVDADPVGKARFLAALGKLAPEVNRLVTDPTEELQLSIATGGRAGISQLNGDINSVQTSSRSEYEGIVRELAGALDLMAAELRQMPGPKLLLVFWQGLEPGLFFDGDLGLKPGSSASSVVGGQRFGPLVTRFTAPLQAIADSGAMTVLVNATAPEDVGADAEGPIRQLAQTAGALYAGGADPQDVEQRIAATTAAAYEAGFYIQGKTPAARETVAVVVKRNGVRAWAPAAIRVRETWETLTVREQQVLVLDLVAGGPQANRGPALRGVEPLGGTVQSRPEGNGGRRLRYQAAWPTGVAGKGLDVYNVALTRPASGADSPKVLKFDRYEQAGEAAAPLEVDLGKRDNLIWGIVAVERATGRAWLRRLQLAGPGAQPPK